MKKTVLVTGATSFIGIAIVKEYIKHNHNVIVIVRPKSKNMSRLPKNPLVEIIELDMSEIGQLESLLKGRAIDVFYHLAWEGTRNPERNDPKIQYDNYCCAVRAMKVAMLLGCKKFIGSGSQAEYGRCIGKIDESYPANPLTEYGKFKLKTYNELKAVALQETIEFIWTRIFSVYGPGDYEGSLISTSINKMLKHEDIALTECIQNWDYIYVDDVGQIMYQLGMSQCEEGIYNIASGLSRPLREFMLEMKQAVGSNSNLKFGEIPYNSEGIVSFDPSIAKLKKNIDVNIKVVFEEGIKNIVHQIGVKDI